MPKTAPKPTKPTKAAKTAPPVTPSSPAIPRPEKIAKTEIIDLMATHSNISKKAATEAFDVALEAMISTLRSGGSVGLPGLGTLSIADTQARSGVKPGTAEKISIPAGKKVRFKLTPTLKTQL